MYDLNIRINLIYKDILYIELGVLYVSMGNSNIPICTLYIWILKRKKYVLQNCY